MANINDNVNIPMFNLPLSSIVEQNSTDNGTYVKFANGILIQYGRRGLTVETERQRFGTITYSKEVSFTLPTAFINANYTAVSDVNIANMNIYVETHASPTTVNTMTLCFVCSNQYETRTVHWLAIGHWK